MRPKWDAAAHKAVEFDDSLAEARNSLAALYFFGDWDCTHGDSESQRAIALDPNYAEARHLRSYILMAMNRPDEAVQEQKRGTELDPFQRPWALGFTYYRLRQFDAAITELRLRAAANPQDGSTHFILSDVYWLKGMFKEAVQEVEQGFLIAADRASADAVTHAFQRGGSRAVAEWRWQNTKRAAHQGYASPFPGKKTARSANLADCGRLPYATAGGEAASDGRFTGADFPGEQANAVMIGQELQPRLGLIPGLRTEQLFGIGAMAERGFLRAEESFYRGGYSFSCFCLSSSTKLMPVGSGLAEAVRFTEGNWTVDCARRTVANFRPQEQGGESTEDRQGWRLRLH